MSDATALAKEEMSVYRRVSKVTARLLIKELESLRQQLANAKSQIAFLEDSLAHEHGKYTETRAQLEAAQKQEPVGEIVKIDWEWGPEILINWKEDALGNLWLDQQAPGTKLYATPLPQSGAVDKGEFGMMMRMLASSVASSKGRDSKLYKNAIEFMKKHGLLGNPLRDDNKADE